MSQAKLLQWNKSKNELTLCLRWPYRVSMRRTVPSVLVSHVVTSWEPQTGAKAEKLADSSYWDTNRLLLMKWFNLVASVSLTLLTTLQCYTKYRYFSDDIEQVCAGTEHQNDRWKWCYHLETNSGAVIDWWWIATRIMTAGFFFFLSFTFKCTKNLT